MPSFYSEPLRDWVEEGIIQHSSLAQAAGVSDPSMAALPIEYPDNLISLMPILAKLGFCPDATDPWEMFRFAKMELPAVLKARRRIKSANLPLHKELGNDAIKMAISNAQVQDLQLYTQWSDMLRCASPPVASVAYSQALATLAEKGDDRVCDTVAGKHVVMWAPSDASALSRCLASFFRSTAEDARPATLIFLSTMPCTAGMNSVRSITDIWSSPALSERWMAIVRDIAFVPFFFEMIMPGRYGSPKHDRCGLAMFSAWHAGPRGVPRMIHMGFILQVGEFAVVNFDMVVDKLTSFLALGQLQCL
ncbi:unnamed protein product [Prorocentrum cordatum]|uniref:Uncharacterized protein n=1 Tax=Prorocentrum cordatum TaxID=2364126 RepID=A0ABN9USH2_9DINO|nr:unnamed protein product [Polarella glacialis]